MANRRMFSKDIIELDDFYDMPHTAQLLYFYLGMYADDDGFVSPKRIIKLGDFKEDDLKILVAKNFVILFEKGVLVITHWKQNNYIQSDRYRETFHKKEKALITQTAGGIYALDTACIQNVSKPDTQVRLGKVRLGKERENKKSNTRAKKINYETILNSKNLFGFRITNALIEKYEEKVLSWSQSKGKVVKDITATIRNWLIKDAEAGRIDKVAFREEFERLRDIEIKKAKEMR
jgi:hypothetical protein